MHRGRRKAEALSVFEGRWYAESRTGLQAKLVAAYAAVVQGQAWLPMMSFKPVVLCRRPPNNGLEGSARTASLFGSLLASLVGAPSAQAFGVKIHP